MSRRFAARVAMAAAIGLSVATGWAPGKVEAMEESPKTAFARVLAVPEITVRGFVAQPLTRLGPQDALWWGVISASGDPQPMLVLRRKCGTSLCTSKALRLPLGAQVQLRAVLDLLGAPVTLNLTGSPGDPVWAQASGAAPTRPAALLRVRHAFDSGEQRSTLVLVALEREPVTVWREIESSVATDGGGFSSHQLALRRESPGAALALELGQATLPGAGKQPHMPGPPLALHFTFDGQAYQRDR